MYISRRNFLVAGQTLLAAAALPMKFFGAANFGSSKATDLTFSTKETFLPLVNSSFAVRSGSLTTAWLTLLSVEDMNSKTFIQSNPVSASRLKASRTTPASVNTFALHFYGTGEELQQGTYELEHHSLGQFSLFLVPSGKSTYMAIISHIQSVTPIQPPKRINSKVQVAAPAEL